MITISNKLYSFKKFSFHLQSFLYSTSNVVYNYYINRNSQKKYIQDI